MNTPSPLARLIYTRMQQLGIGAQALGFRLGHSNAAKAAGRVYALCEGYLAIQKSKAALARLPGALELPSEVIERAIAAAEQAFSEQERQRWENLRLAREAEEAEWRLSFSPHAIIQTKQTTPSQITICGRVEEWLLIHLDPSQPPITFVQQVVVALSGSCSRAPTVLEGPVLRRSVRIHYQLLPRPRAPVHHHGGAAANSAPRHTGLEKSSFVLGTGRLRQGRRLVCSASIEISAPQTRQ